MLEVKKNFPVNFLMLMKIYLECGNASWVILAEYAKIIQARAKKILRVQAKFPGNIE